MAGRTVSASRAPLKIEHGDDPRGAKGYTDYFTLAQERGEATRPRIDDRWR
jgi:hypothetical protein